MNDDLLVRCLRTIVSEIGEADIKELRDLKSFLTEAAGRIEEQHRILADYDKRLAELRTELGKWRTYAPFLSAHGYQELP